MRQADVSRMALQEIVDVAAWAEEHARRIRERAGRAADELAAGTVTAGDVRAVAIDLWTDVSLFQLMRERAQLAGDGRGYVPARGRV